MRTFLRLRSGIALALMLSLLCVAAVVRAGTTGGLTGTVLDGGTGQPLAGARVSIVSPSQTAASTTDASGRFAFLSLAPDTYTLSVEKAGYDSYSNAGISIFADQTQQLSVRTARTLRTIANVRSRSNSELVRPGTVTDVYSVNAATQARVTSLGGGGSLDQAYSALATVPGVFVPSANNGWSQAAGVVIRGGTHTQVGYEFDGVPVNVGYSFFPGSNLSTLGQQELQAYTGSAPANAQSQGLSGFINQVIKTGTYPGYVDGDVAIGSPFYHKASFEIGGATTNRNFTYYVGLLGANQAFNMVDNFNGASYTYPYGTQYDVVSCPTGAQSANFASCYNATTPGGLNVGPGGFKYLPPNYNNPAYQQDRENVVNLHFAVPQGKSGVKDDVQLLYDTGGLTTFYNTAQTDLPPGVITSQLKYANSHTYAGALGQALPANYASLVKPYFFPQQPVSAYASGLIPPGLRDSQQANQTISKVQYQHNLGSTGYARVFAYTLYSNRFDNGPNSAVFFGGQPPDYAVWTHTSGYAAEFAQQLSSANVLQGALSYTHAPSVRDNSTTWATSANAPFAVAVDSSNPSNGVCYGVAVGAATPASCQPGDKQAAFVTYNNVLKGTSPTALTGLRCGTGPCEYLTVENGLGGNFNAVTQNVYSASLSDQWKPTGRLTIDAGLKYHDYLYTGGNTGSGTRPFWFNAYNNDFCVNSAPGNAPVTKKSLKIAVTAACSTAVAPAGVSYVSPGLTNGPANYAYGELEPRIGFTYALGTNDVVRGSYGKYTQPTETGFMQYDTNQQNLPAYLGSHFYSLGFNTPGHAIPPQESFNTDFSLEHAFRGTDMSFKATPFYRATRNELTEFFIDPAKQITSGLAVGSLRTSGVEFQFRKGSFDRNGLSALLSYTYTTARINYQTLPNGGTILSPINNDIKTYNGYTSFCNAHATDPRCGATNAANGSGKAAACFTAAGAPDPGCAAGSIANPYWNAPVQSLLDPNGSYWPTDPVVATTALGVNGYTVPHVATMVVNYRHDRFAITPSLQFQAGQRYGAPEANAGIDPGQGCTALAGTTAGDPRYPYGAVGGAPYNALTCNAALNAIPNVYTKQFDPIGAFISPSQLLGGLTLSYDVSNKVGLTVTMANVLNQCFGGSQTAWTQATGSRLVCSYESGEVSRGYAPTGNVYNPGAKFEPFAQYPYFPYLGPYTMGVVNPSAPFSIFVNMHVRV